MNKSSKILTIILIGLIILTLFAASWFLFGKKDKVQEIIQSNLPITSQVDNSNSPGQLFGPKEADKARELSADKIIEITNVYRAKENLTPLTKNSILAQAAQAKVDDMFNKQYFEHVSPDGITPADLVLKSGYNYKITGENLALGDFDNEQDLVDAWYASPGHRANIMNPEFVEIGVASNLNDFEGRNTWLSVQEFGHLAPNCNKPNQSLSTEIDNQKNEYEKISDQIENLTSEAQKLAQLANEKITEGNKIYEETHDKSKATSYWNEGSLLRTQSQDKFAQAKNLDGQLKKLYDKIQILTKEYNNQVSTYNSCIKK